ncbi:MAG: hypothetical protein ACTSWY_11455 [Promethearchaeota archaeon]
MSSVSGGYSLKNDREGKEIGIALSQYHQKIGPRFVGISYDFSKFSTLTQYDILQDSVSSRSEELKLFVMNKNDEEFIVHIRKIRILDPLARGNVQKFAIILFIPLKLKNLHPYHIVINEISRIIKEKLSAGENIRGTMKKWYTQLNNKKGGEKKESSTELSESIKYLTVA